MSQTITLVQPGGREFELILWTDVDLEQMAQVDEYVIARARSYWRTRLPASLRDVLNASRTIGGE
jgi:hypothetical protein